MSLLRAGFAVEPTLGASNVFSVILVVGGFPLKHRKLKTKGEFVPVEVHVTDQDVSRVRHKLQQVWRAIEAGIIYRSKSWACAGCPWSKRCAEADLACI